MMQQYLRIKADYPHALVFYRMGDFMNCFWMMHKVRTFIRYYPTHRGKTAGNPIPMAGVHHAEGYVAKWLLWRGPVVIFVNK